MARQINRLNALKVKSLTIPGRYADGNGLYLEINKSGAKSWAYLFQWHGKTRQKGLGPLRRVGLADAREKAQQAAQLVAQGIDPIAHEKNAITESDPTFGDVALQFITDRESGWKNAKHRQQWRNTLETYAQPIWSKAIAEVTVRDVLTILRPIWSIKPETAKRVRGRIETVLDAAKVLGLRKGENPASWRGNLDHILARHRKGPKRHHPAMPFDSVPGFMRRLNTVDGQAARALALLIHTACRTSEVLLAQWEEFDLDGAIWTIPADRMKAGKEHRIPLSREALELLKSIPRIGDYLFPGQKAGKPLSNMAMTMVMRRMNLNEFTVHGFRSSFRDWCGECTSISREIAEQALAHQVGSEVERAYRRGDALERRRALMQQWSTFLMRCNGEAA